MQKDKTFLRIPFKTTSLIKLDSLEIEAGCLTLVELDIQHPGLFVGLNLEISINLESRFQVI